MSETDFLSTDQIIFQIIIFPSYNLNDKKTQIDPIILYRNYCTNFISSLSPSDSKNTIIYCEI